MPLAWQTGCLPVETGSIPVRGARGGGIALPLLRRWSARRFEKPEDPVRSRGAAQKGWGHRPVGGRQLGMLETRVRIPVAPLESRSMAERLRDVQEIRVRFPAFEQGLIGGSGDRATNSTGGGSTPSRGNAPSAGSARGPPECRSRVRLPVGALENRRAHSAARGLPS